VQPNCWTTWLLERDDRAAQACGLQLFCRRFPTGSGQSEVWGRASDGETVFLRYRGFGQIFVVDRGIHQFGTTIANFGVKMLKNQRTVSYGTRAKTIFRYFKLCNHGITATNRK